MGISDDHWIPNTPHINFGKISGDSVEVLLWTSESPHRKFALISLCTRCFNLVLSGICIKHTKRNISLSEVIRWNIQHSLICSIVFLGFSMGFPKKSHPGLKTTTFLKQRQTSDAASATALVDAASRCGSPGIHHAASGVGRGAVGCSWHSLGSCVVLPPCVSTSHIPIKQAFWPRDLGDLTLVI